MKRQWLRRWLLPPALCLVPAAFCHAGGHCTDNCANIPKGAQPAPNGTYVNKFIEVQSNLAEADDFVFYKHMWFMGGTTLGPLGRYQLDLMARRLPNEPFPVVIETSKNDAVDEARGP